MLDTIHFKRILGLERWQYLFAGVVVSLIATICLAFSMGGGDAFDLSRREVLLRKIGHQLLLQSGDSTSRVLPVKELADNKYQLGFENPFSFQPDSLLQITKCLLAGHPLSSNYVVNVLNCADSSVAYGYAISGTKKDDIISCLGRTQPKACYLLSITFGPAKRETENTAYLLGGLALSAMAGYVVLRRARRRPVFPEEQQPTPAEPSPANQQPITVFMLGETSFDATARTLILASTTTELTKTEARVLRMFAAAPNEVIERSRLQKEIWEDEGVIVGRSLDMFISKLRKKLEPDPGIRIAVIRGKGYKLEIDSPENSL